MDVILPDLLIEARGKLFAIQNQFILMSIFDKLKDINEMRKQAKQLEAQLAQVIVTGKSAGDKIKIVTDGNQKVLSVEVDATVAGDKSEVARHVRAALEDLFKQHKKMLQSKFGNMMS